MQVEPTSVWLKEEFGARAFFPESDGSFNIQAIIALSGSLKVEGTPHDESPRSQSHTPQHQAYTLVVPPTASPAPVFRSVVARRRIGGRPVSEFESGSGPLVIYSSWKAHIHKLGPSICRNRRGHRECIAYSICSPGRVWCKPYTGY